MASKIATGEGYAVAMGELWSGLARTLARLDRIASDLDGLGAAPVVESLRRLQYALHSASEDAYGLVPPPGAEAAHAELAAALASARDATADVVEAVEDGGIDAAAVLVHEWRGALFRVRLARLRLAGNPPEPPRRADDGARPELAAPLAAFVLALAGAVAFVVGATIGPWLLWVGGMFAICASVLVYRP